MASKVRGTLWENEEQCVPKLPRVTARELLRALQADGWYEIRSRGSHLRLAHPNRAQKVTVAVHAGEIVKPGTLQTILDAAGMSVERFIELL
jgi:predicted RNA binding protein YcfA (HicA-like mRNA interferase family)